MVSFEGMGKTTKKDGARIDDFLNVESNSVVGLVGETRRRKLDLEVKHDIPWEPLYPKPGSIERI